MYGFKSKYPSIVFLSIFYTTYISVDLTHHEIFHGKVGINEVKQSW